MMATLRVAGHEDAEEIARIYAPHVTAGIVSFEARPPDASEIRRRMGASAGLYPWIVAAEAGDAVLGYAYATAFSERAAYRWAVETSVYVADAAQGRGVGRRLYAALLATLTAQGFGQAVGRIAMPNRASVALHVAAGFRHAGDMQAIGWKQDAWVDVGYWQRTLAPRSTPPAEPRPFVEVGLVER
jgi:L-amino acid N-acyltransferase YncA